LDDYEKKWGLSPAPVLSIHGKEDAIVPYQNSLFLESLFGVDQFQLISLEKGNHSLIWTNFDLIKSELIKSIGE
jgi:pimeloyl-ACP methyl ester carboxylesterase